MMTEESRQESNDKLKLVGHVYEFGPFRLVPSERLLLRDGEPVAVKPKAFDTLVILVEHNGHIVKKEELIRMVWPDAFVEESNLNHYVSILRKTLSDGGDGDGYIETIRRHGFRFTADVHRVASEDVKVIRRRRTHSQLRITQEVREHQLITGAPRFGSWRRLALGMLAIAAVLAMSGFAVSRFVSSHRSAAAANLPAKRRTPNAAAYEAYVKGRASWSQRTDEGFKQATEYFKQAIALDPSFAPGYAGLADCYLLYGVALEQTSPYTFHEALKKALELDDSLGEAHATLAYYKSAVEWDWAGAEKEFERAIALNPNYATAHQWHAYNLISTSNAAAAIAEITRAQEIDPTSLIINADVGHIYYLAGRNDLAFLALHKTLQMDPNFGDAHLRLGEVYAQEGRYDEAIVELENAEKLKGGENLLAFAYLGYVYALSGKKAQAQEVINKIDRSTKETLYPEVYDKALILAVLGQKDEAFKLLNQAYERRQGSLSLLKVEPKLDSLRSDPRFGDLLLRMGLPS
jgi:DNA-binding winged helix-turn-helix (wHTH) protein/tetratricopeptide (TPR) repeat protein